MSNNFETFGKRLSESMKKQGITNGKLTEELKLSKNAIGNYINNQIPNSKILFNLSQKLGISMEYLLTGKIDNNKEIDENEAELLKYFRRLPEREQIKIIGIIEEKAEPYKEQSEKPSISKTG